MSALEGEGYKFVLTAERTLMSEYHGQIFLGFSACAPRGLIPDEIFFSFLSPPVEANPDGSAKFAELGTRKIEAALLEDGFDRRDVIVAHPDHIGKVVGSKTKVLALTEHDPLGFGPPTSTFVQLLGGEPYMLVKLKELLNHPSVQKSHPKIIVGGGGAWQLKSEKIRKELGVDCVVLGEGEKIAAPLFEKAARGEDLPGIVQGETVPEKEIPLIRGPTICGLVEISRGCGRGCDFCIPDMLKVRYIPQDRILKEVEVNFKAGRKPILHSEDVLRYRAKGFQINKEAVLSLFKAVKEKAGSAGISHFSLSSVAAAPDVVEGISNILNIGSPGNSMWFSGQTGLETGSPDLVRRYMGGKCRPFSPGQWPDMVVKAFEVLHDNNWVPCSTLLLGFPGETEKDIQYSIDLVEKLNGFKSLIVPMFMVSTEDPAQSFKAADMTPKHGELFLDCWEHDLKWGKILLTEYVNSVDRKVEEGIELVFKMGFGAIEKLIKECRDVYGFDVPAMIKDYQSGAKDWKTIL